MTPLAVLAIGGSDSSGGSGLQADVKVFAAMRLYGATVATSVTAQNTRGVQDVFELPGNVVSAQLSAVLEDLPIKAVKVGMLATAEAAAAVTAKARAGVLPNLVVDPVLEAAAGRRRGVVSALERLLPFAAVATPNRDEASALVGWQVSTPADMAGAAAQIASNGPKYVVVTGGDMVAGDEAVDAVWTDAGARFLRYPRVQTRNNRGTGCTFSAAITSRLAQGDDVLEALVAAKEYVTRSLVGARDWDLGNGSGPLNHFDWPTFAAFSA
ncbi:bifunctional hydroxymethylpyrimidine kinase/phosphomethylpyrimidine kinase [Asanoa siamensis]|uniref:Hydroxymethylpyrimidine/phosphomethylpyrimidine kinase n=1 Tax=Asanoa siamensis TaxID=926357 RepID=A0ABQ4CNP4_9ACTN|nr:bifunctional hydroxymethylpyrimidine kinase/phosphomethylpyrimidine kinase [Asanoa siamensis]GIF72902.1 hydroxymethylpyrimidine/phosphomethylpyrimidine kinase [Asanoa siamensis]